MGILHKEETIIYERHSKKWNNLTHRHYPLLRECYQVKHQPQFHFHFNDVWWPGTVINSDVSITVNNGDRNNFYTNDSNYDVPEKIKVLLEKGPKFRVPVNLKTNLIRETEMQLEVLTYKLRYKNIFSNTNKTNHNLIVPFSKNNVSLPERMNYYQENSLTAFKREVINVLEKEVKVLKKDKNLNKLKEEIKATKTFLNENNLLAVKSDKTNRIVITDEEVYLKKSLDMLENTANYKYRKQSKSKQIETQANRLIRNIGLNKFDKSSREKLISSGTHPANFVTLIKDHKTKTELGFPLRPVASTTNTPTNKIDWIVSRILNQLLEFIPSYIKNTEHLIKKLEDINKDLLKEGKIFVSLDVVNLYPSIPIDEAINAVLDFAKLFWNKIDNFGFSIEELSRCLSFISYNYEVQFQDRTYLQIKGCPMGAHFSPPFAIIFMHRIETEALRRLNTVYKILPQLYARYIDDIIIGPFDKDNELLRRMLEVFNAINDNIKFTIEIPAGETNKLNYLDMTITIKDTKIEYEWYQKSCHSGILLREDSHLPQHVKKNFVNNTIKRIESRCSNAEIKEEKISHFKNSLKHNGYGDKQILNYTGNHRGNKRNNKHKNNRHSKTTSRKKTPLIINYVNERTNRKINQLISKYDIDVRLVSKPSPNLNTVLKKKKIVHQNCEICKKVGTKYNCKSRYLVYKFTCKFCNKAYIGQTARPFYFRYREHKFAVDNSNQSSALSEHILKDHRNDNCNIDSFSLEFLELFKSPIESRIGEALWIRYLQPALNRKKELTHW